MTDFDKKLDEIAADAFDDSYDQKKCTTAMLAAIELFAQREPSTDVLDAGLEVDEGNDDPVAVMRELFRAMQAAQLAEIKEGME